ncbi:AIP3 domain-containing protein [Meloidogyne graminicola]|uniref:AIP3 domain-containing protein n=1 Tax=Meloidogyne graminicola TaxID=189291 RepID=A0A8S9ZTA0_9BILA|nr:AIP3 domain-containing protein [Meloidogyne graminicola]
MPKPSSLFTKLQVRLKKFPRLDEGPDSTDEEGENHNEFKKFPNPLFDGEIIETAPKMPSTLNNSGIRQQRAVRFSEGQQEEQQQNLIDVSPINGQTIPPRPPPLPTNSSFPSSINAALPPKPKSPQPAPRRSFSQINSSNNYYSDNNYNFEEQQQSLPPPRPNKNNNFQRTNSLLKQMRNSESNEYDEQQQQIEYNRTDLFSSSPSSQQQIYLFLEHQGETKRSILPSNIHSIENLKNSPHGLFYELENIEDLEDSCILRLFEQNLPPQPPTTIYSPSSFIQRKQIPVVEYLSCGHTSDSSTCSTIGGGGGIGGGSFSIQQPSIYYTKSGSSTPREEIVEQQETRRKVDNLERQMATLCSLVHCALYKDNKICENNQQQLIQFDKTLALPNSSILIQKEWRNVINEIEIIKEDLNILKLEVERNTINGNEMIKNVLNQIKITTNNNNLFQQNSIIGNHINRLSNVQCALKSFESNLENTRSAVLNSTRRLKLDEVNELTAALGEIGREAVELKIEIPILQKKVEMEIKQTMERLSKEEHLLQEKIPLVDGFLRRCKTLANMMVTMKKLAIIQDEECSQTQRRTIPVRQISLRNFRPPIITSSQINGNHPLDAILDELGENNRKQNNLNGTNEIVQASFTLRLGSNKEQNGNIW